MPMRARFPRSARLTAASDFDAAFKTGQRYNHPFFGLHWRAEPAAPARLGLAVSRKVDGRAVGRNRIKRALRERFRALRSELAGGDYVFVARPAAAKAGATDLVAAMTQLLQRAGAWKQSTGEGAPGTMRSAALAGAAANPDVSTHDPAPAPDAG